MSTLPKRGLPNYLILALFSVSLLAPKVISAQSSSSGSLQINPSNSHYFFYKGQSKFLITDKSKPDYTNIDSQYNHKTMISLTATGRSPMLYNNEDINAGWNENSWQQIRSVVSNANSRNAIVGVKFWSTPMLEECESRWYTHLWNARNGGPIDVDCDGKGEFYTLADYGNEISGPYDDNWSWQRKNQFRQEELVKKYLSELADFPNVYYIPMYEMGDHWGSNQSDIRRWHRHIVKMVTDRQPERLIGSVISTGDEQWIAEMDEIDILLFEGPGIPSSSDMGKFAGDDGYWPYNKPMVWDFIYPDPDDAVGDMREAVVNGLQPAEVVRGRTDEQVDFAQRLSDFIETVDTWCDEPGQEITSSAVPGVSGGSGTDLPPGSCSDDGGSAILLEGDLDKDGDVDIFDYNILVTNFGSTNCGNVADINSDCKVDIFDYNILIENFGS